MHRLHQVVKPTLVRPITRTATAGDCWIRPSTAGIVPNFAAMAQAAGIRGIRLVDPSEVKEGIPSALAHDGPVLIDAEVNQTDLAMAPSITLQMAKGFSLYMLKAGMSGRGDEAVDLAVSNLWR